MTSCSKIGKREEQNLYLDLDKQFRYKQVASFLVRPKIIIKIGSAENFSVLKIVNIIKFILFLNLKIVFVIFFE